MNEMAVIACAGLDTLFDFDVQNAYINSQLQDELTDMRVDLEAQSLFKPKTCVTVQWKYRC